MKLLRIFTSGAALAALLAGSLGCSDSGDAGGSGGSGGAESCGPGPFTPVANFDCMTIPSVKTGSADFAISTTAFEYCGTMPAENTCDGKPFGTGSNPALTIANVPAGTMSLALVFADIAILAENDPARERFGYHSVMWDIPPTTTSIPAAMTGGYQSAEIPGALQWSGRNSYAFFPPCPNPFPAEDPLFQTAAMCGVVTDSYAFRLYALPMATLDGLPEPDINADTGMPSGNYVVNMAHYIESLPALAVTEYRGTSSAWSTMFAPADPVQYPCTQAMISAGMTDSCLMRTP